MFWGLSASLAYKRHFPAIDWLVSYSLYADKMKEWYDEEVGRDFLKYRQFVMTTLQEEAALDEIVRLVGMDALSARDRLTMETAKMIREDSFDGIFSEMNAELKAVAQGGEEDV